MPDRPRPPRIALGLLCLVTPLGCAAGTTYEHAKVHGKVTYAGKPVTFGSVLFMPMEEPKDGLIQLVRGDIQPDGTYTLVSENDAGAVVGSHKVIMIAVEGDKPVEAKADVAPTPSRSKGNVQFKSAVPKKYSDPTATPLVRTVKPGDNVVDLELVD